MNQYGEVCGAHLSKITVKSQHMLYKLSRDILYRFVLGIGGLQPAFDRGRTLAGEVEFAH